MSNETKTVADLNAELAQIDADLLGLTETERKAEKGIGELSLAARRGDQEAQGKLEQFDASCAATTIDRRRLLAARVSVEAELVVAQAIVDCEAAKTRAREAKEITEVFRERGAKIDAGIRAFVDEYFNLRSDAAALARLGVGINSELVRVNSLRALSAALQRTDLGLPKVSPLQRHSFAELVGVWAATAERWIATTLNEPESNGERADAAIETEMPPPKAAAPHIDIHVTDGSDPNFEIKAAQPRMN